MSEEIKKPFNPFGSKVIKRDYTQDMIKADIGERPANQIDEDIPEPTYDRPPINEEEDIPTSSTSQSSSNNGGGSSESAYSTPPEEPKHVVNSSLEDLDAKQKRKAAKETAEALLTTYARFVPMPFIKISSFNMNKMNKLNMSGEINLKMVVQEDGTTIESYMNGFNNQVEETFKITEEMKDELRDPLIDVLMEQGLALTPTQRLGLAFGGHLIQMGVSTAQLVMAKKDSLETFKEFKKSDDAKGLSSQYARTPQPKEQYREEPITPQQSYDAPPPVQPKEEEYEKPSFDLENYINDDIPENDSSITIEEVENEQPN